HHRVDRVLQLQDFALHVHRDLLRQVTGLHGFRHVGDVAHLCGEVTGHEVHGVGEVLPYARDPLHVGLPARSHCRGVRAGHASHCGGDTGELTDHRVDGVLQFEDFAADVHGHFLGQVTRGDGGRHFGDVAHLSGEVTRHEVHGVGEVLPYARDPGHVGLPA